MEFRLGEYGGSSLEGKSTRRRSAGEVTGGGFYGTDETCTGHIGIRH